MEKLAFWNDPRPLLVSAGALRSKGQPQNEDEALYSIEFLSDQLHLSL